MRSIERSRFCVPWARVLTGILLAASSASCSTSVSGDESIPEPAGMTVKHEIGKTPLLVAVDGEGQAFSTYWHGTDDLGNRMIITVENPDSGEKGQYYLRASAETGVTEISTMGDFGEGTWSDEGLEPGAEPPVEIVGAYEPWFDFWTQKAKDPFHARHLKMEMARPDGDVSLQSNPVCSAVCGIVKGSACNFKNAKATFLCNLVGYFVCEGFCAIDLADSEIACYVTDDGYGCVQETCCQTHYGCWTTPISGCPY
jgi:hypothetical protein